MMKRKMKKNYKKWFVLCMAAMLLVSAMPISAKADGVEGEEKPFLALGADLKASEKATVYQLLGVSETNLANYDVIQVTNADEKKYLGEYMDASVIGSRALSSVLVEKQADGTGITVDTHNITYCTQGMYTNALITAGIKNARVVVAGPFNITGTAALVGAMEAYSVMTGEEISEEAMDTAVNELVLTGEIAENTGDSNKVEELMALVKQNIAEENLDTPEEIKDAIVEAAKELNFDLSNEQIEQVTKLMGKVSDLDLDVDSMKEQAKKLYDKLADLGVNTDGLGAKISNFFNNIISSVVDFIGSLFN